MPTVQYVSDLHLDHYATRFIIEPTASILVIAGDFCSPFIPKCREFLIDCSEKWDYVILVLGNHEYYNRHCSKWASNSIVFPPYQVEKKFEEILSDLPNVKLLTVSSPIFCLDEAIFIGSTLWTDIPEDKYAAASRGMNDYSYIPYDVNRSRLTPQHVTEWHKTHYDCLKTALEKYADDPRPKVVITHHLPSHSLTEPRYQNHPLACCFSSASDELISLANVWIYGHSHTSNEQMIGSTRCLINARGYLGESTGFDPSKNFSI